MPRANEDDFQFPDEKDEAGNAALNSAGFETELDNEIEVEVIDDTPAADRGRKPLDKEVADPSDDELQEYSTKVQTRIKDLTHARHDERRKAEALARERDELTRVTTTVMRERDELRKQLQSGTKVLTEQSLTLADAAVAEAKAKLKAAHEAFDTDAIVDAQEELNTAQMRKASATNSRERAVQDAENVVESQQQVQPAAPKLDAKTQQWLTANKSWFGDGGDKAMTGFALGLHQELVEKHGEGYTRTDEYYSQIDDAVRRTFPTKFGKPAAKQERQDSVVAPASRVLAPRKVTLTPTQVALAKKFGMTPQQYAAELVKLES